MTSAITFLPEAENDVDHAYGWYEQNRVGLGDQFLEELRRVIDRLVTHPHLYGVVRSDIGAGPLHRFPWVAYYRVCGSTVVMVAVQHGRRSYRSWWNRVK